MEESLKDFFEAVKLMEVGDPILTWDVDHMRLAASQAYRWAKDHGWRISVRCDPPSTAKYIRISGRISIWRIA